MKGQTLIEVLVGLGVGVAVLVAITSVVLSSLANAQFSKNQNLATQYAQQGMEIVRDLRNTLGWSTFYERYTFDVGDGNFCLPENDTTQNNGYCSGPVIGSFFKREVRFVRMPPDFSNTIRVFMTVSFTDSKGEHKSELITVFTNWQ